MSSVRRRRGTAPSRSLVRAAAALALAVAVAGCSTSDPDPDPAGAEAEPTPAAESPEPSPASDDAEEFLEGGWRTTYGTLTFEVAGTEFTGDYDTEDGRLVGTVEGRTVRGEWYEPSSAQACSSERGDTVYWGTFIFEFSEDGDSFDGTWGYCGDPETRSWDGERIAASAEESTEAAEAPEGLIDPTVVDEADVFVALTTDQVVAPPPGGEQSYGEATLRVDGDRVEVVVAVELLPGDVAIGAGIYRGTPGLDGPSILDLGDFANGSPEGQAVWIDEVELPMLAEAWRSDTLGDFYVEVVTELGPSGLVRGQLGVR